MIRQLFTSVAVALAIVLPAWIIWRVILHRRYAATGGAMPLSRELLRVVMVAYATTLVVLTLLPLQNGRGSAEPNLVPFRSILQCISQTLSDPNDLLTHCTADFVANIVLLFPFGLLAPLFPSRPTSARQILLAAALISAGIEFIQLLERAVGGARSPDIDDVILNVLGAWAGYLTYRIIFLRQARFRGNDGS